MTKTITYETITYDALDEDYDHPDYGRVKFVAFSTTAAYGYFRSADGCALWLRYDSFPPPEPEPETVTVKMPMRNPGKEPFASFTFTFTHDEARAAIKALQDALPGDDVWVRLSRGDAEHDYQRMDPMDCTRCRRVEAAITEALER